MIVCDRCRKEKRLTKYMIPTESWIHWNATNHQDQILQTYTEYKIFPKEIELCNECAIEVAKRIWS